MVARMSLGVRRFTQITLTVRVTLKEMPLTSNIPALPITALGAQANITKPNDPRKQLSA